MLSPIDVIQWVYSEADQAHLEHLLLCNETRLVVIVTSCRGDIRFRNDVVDGIVSLNGSESLTASPPRLAVHGILRGAASAALAGCRSSGSRSVLWRVPATGGGDWLILGCRGVFDGETSAFLLVGGDPAPAGTGRRAQGRAARQPPDGQLPATRVQA